MEMTKARLWLFSFILIAAVLPATAGSVFHVDSGGGEDSNPGTASAPWKTIQKAADSMAEGDTAVVSGGDYPERVYITRSGNPGSIISFTTSGKVQCRGISVLADYVQVKGFRVTATRALWTDRGYGIWVEGKSCLIEANDAYYSPRGGIHLRPNSSDCVVRDNRAWRNGMTGLEIHGTGHLIEGNEVWGSIAHHTPTGATGDADGIRFFGTGHVFRGNYIHDISYQDPENAGYSPHIDGFQTWEDANHAAASRILFERNRIVLPVFKNDAANGHGFMLHHCSHIVIRNNLVVAHGGTNTDTSGSGKPTHHLTIVANTFVGSLAFPRSNHPVGISLENCPDSVVRNNIVYDQRDTAILIKGSTFSGLSMSNNCIYNSDRSTPGGARGRGDLWEQDPLFEAPGKSDFHLQPDSPCIDAGMTIPDLTDDLDGLPRPAGKAFDIGAYEFQTGSRKPDPPPRSIPPLRRFRNGIRISDKNLVLPRRIDTADAIPYNKSVGRWLSFRRSPLPQFIQRTGTSSLSSSVHSS